MSDFRWTGADRGCELEGMSEDDLFRSRYAAVHSRDNRFDGQFVTAVASTGIYCRPSCPALTPKRENVRFFLTAAAAHDAGYRACKRCLPQAAPGSPQWNLRQDLAARAMRLIEDGVMDRGGVQELSRNLGYSVRHVHRTLVAELGAGPASLARAHRAQVARSLLTGTHLSISEVGFASGFGSSRQFNSTIRELYDMTPGQIRARAASGRSGHYVSHSLRGARPQPISLELDLPVRQPFDAPGSFTFLAQRAVEGVESADMSSNQLRYARSLLLPHGPAAVQVRASLGSLGEWTLRLTCELSSLADIGPAVQRVRRLLDVDADPVAVDSALAGDPHLGPLVQRTPGVRLIGTVDAQEYLVRAIVGQQISVKAARTHLCRLVRQWGDSVQSSFPGVQMLFPSAARIAEGLKKASEAYEPADPNRPLRLPRRSVQTVQRAAEDIAEGKLALHSGMEPDAVRDQLLSIPGVGPWTAAYLGLRVFGDPNVWMTGDVALLAGAEQVGLLGPDLTTSAAHRKLAEHATQWAPWRSYAAMHLWQLAALKAR